MILFISVVFLVLLIIGTPIAFVMGLTTLFTFFQLDNPALYMQIPQRMYGGMGNFVLLAIPFFIMAGDIMTRIGITRGLVYFCNVLVGHLRGGLGHVNIVAEMFLSGITGSAVADAAALGSVLIPAMNDEGYDKDFSAALVAASAVLGPIIPPSIPMVVYASIMNVSLAGLFLAGFLPGALIALGMMVVVYIIAKQRNYPVHQKRPPFREFLRAFKQAIPSLLMPFIILGGILSGIFTPTEASVVAVAYGLFLGVFFTRNLTWKDFIEITRNTFVISSTILFVIGASIACGYILTYEQIPQKIAKLILGISPNVYVNLLIFNMIFFIAGMFMDLAVTIVVLGPVLLPAAIEMGIHPLHFAIIMCTNLSIGLATPPYGLILFVVCAMTKITMEKLVNAIWPFILVQVIVVLLISYVPFISMILPKIFGFYN